MTVGLAYYAAQKFPEAKAAFQGALDEADAAKLPRHEVIADTKEMLGEILYSEARIPEAEKVLLSASDDYEALPGQHPRRILQIFFLGLVGYSIGKPGAAENEVQQLAQIFEDPNHLGGLVLIQKLRAQALADVGHSDESRKAQQQVDEMCSAHTAGTELACGIVERPNWILRCPPCNSRTRASSIELLRALNAYDFSIGQT
jgi:tetratricopeptide (TPR) repeat protein